MATPIPIPANKAEVTLVGKDGNAFAVMGEAQRAMRAAGYDKALIAQYFAEAMSGDYDHLLQVTMAYCEVS